MKIVLVANTDWYLFNFRLKLAKELLEAGHDVVMVSPPGDYVTSITDAGIEWQKWIVGRKTLSPLGEIKAIWTLSEVYKSIRPDIVHHSTMKPVLYGSIAARMNRIPGIVNSVTGLGYIWLSSSRKIRLLRPLIRLLFKVTLASDRIRLIFENEEDQAFFISERLAPKARTVVIPGVGVGLHR